MIISKHHEVCYWLFALPQRCSEELKANLFLLVPEVVLLFHMPCLPAGHKAFAITYNCINTLLRCFKAYQSMYMIWHPDLSGHSHLFYVLLILNDQTIYTLNRSHLFYLLMATNHGR